MYEQLIRNINLLHLKESFREFFADLPEIVHSLNIILESGKVSPDISEVMRSRKVAIKTCEESRIIDPNLPKEELIQELKKNKMLINDLKGSRLETDARKLFRRKMGYEIEDSGKNWEIEQEDIKYLIDEKCQKDSSTKSVEVDIFGNKKDDDIIIYIIGECKFRSKKMNLEEIKCFIIKSSIIAKKILKKFDHSDKTEIKFHLIAISLEGFPDSDNINPILDKYWDIPNGKLFKKGIDVINRENFITLLKRNNISVDLYKSI